MIDRGYLTSSKYASPANEKLANSATPDYDTEMTVQTFRDLLARRPFEPFRLVMSSGQSYEVRHPEMAWLTRTTLYVGVAVAPEGVPEEAKMLSLLHIASVEPLTPAAST